MEHFEDGTIPYHNDRIWEYGTIAYHNCQRWEYGTIQYHNDQIWEYGTIPYHNYQTWNMVSRARLEWLSPSSCDKETRVWRGEDTTFEWSD
jgi:hypothetical protein